MNHTKIKLEKSVSEKGIDLLSAHFLTHIGLFASIVSALGWSIEYRHRVGKYSCLNRGCPTII